MKFPEFVYRYKFFSLLSIIYLLTRFVNLSKLPIFTDESIYLYWAKFIATYKSHWFLPLTDGKPPLFVWMISILMSILPKNMYLEAGRTITVLIGFIGLIGLYKLTHELFKFVSVTHHSKNTSNLILFNLKLKSENIAVLSVCILYILSPYTFFYDRMVLFDTPLSTSLIWSIYLSVKLVKEINLKNSLLLGLVIGISFYFKSTALIFWFLIPLVIGLLYFSKIKKNPDKNSEWKKLITLTILSLVISQLINQSLRVSSAYPAFTAKNSQFQHPFDEIIKYPTRYLIGNLPTLIEWTRDWLTYPIFYLCLLGVLTLLVSHTALGLILALLIFTPIVGLATLGRELFPRYLLFITPYLYISSGFLIYKILNFKYFSLTIFGIIIYIIIFLNAGFNTFKLSIDPITAPMPSTDYEQYVKGHPSGYGIYEVYNFIDTIIANNRRAIIVTEGTFGLYPYAFNLKYWDNPNVIILPRWPIKFDSEITQKASTQPVYLILKDHDTMPHDWPISLIKVIPKPNGGRPPIILTQVNLNQTTKKFPE